MENTKKRLIIWAAIVLGILMIPLIAMKFTQEVNWDITDFAVMGAILIGIGLAYEMVGRRSDKTIYRTAFGVGLLGAFLLFWVNAAVGIIGSEGQDANLLYGAVFVVGLVGSLRSRFKPRGMATTLFAAAITQLLVPVAAYLIWPPPVTSWSPSVLGVFLLSGSFAILFVISAMLFKNATDNTN